MASFDDMADPELAAACNRLAAWVEPLPEGVLIDPPSRLTENDLALILRRLYATRHIADREEPRAAIASRAAPRPSVPLTIKD